MAGIVKTSADFENATVCGKCDREFSWVDRRHHCRNCAKSFCWKCSQWKVNIAGEQVRVCEKCKVFLEPLLNEKDQKEAKEALTGVTAYKRVDNSSSGHLFFRDRTALVKNGSPVFLHGFEWNATIDDDDVLHLRKDFPDVLDMDSEDCAPITIARKIASLNAELIAIDPVIERINRELQAEDAIAHLLFEELKTVSKNRGRLVRTMKELEGKLNNNPDIPTTRKEVKVPPMQMVAIPASFLSGEKLEVVWCPYDMDDSCPVLDLCTVTKKIVDEAVGELHRTQGGTKGAADGRFAYAAGVTTTLTEMFVADSANHRIQVFDLNGKHIRQWGTKGCREGQFNSPIGVAVKGSEVFVVDWGNNRIAVFDLNGEPLRYWGAGGHEPGCFEGPRGIAVRREEVFVADCHNNRIQVFNLEGEFLYQWGEAGQLEGQFHGPYGIAVKGREVFVVDSDNNRVQVFNLDGQFLRQWGAVGSSDGFFEEPLGIAVEGKEVFISEKGSKRVQVFDLQGTFLRNWKCGDDSDPFFVAVNRLGEVIVSGYQTHCLQVFH